MSMSSPGDRYEGFVDRLIRESMERGDFDDLAGEGRPIPGAGSVDDELWWVRRWVKQNLESGQSPSNSS
jgi:hypothetical protein